MGTPVTVLSVRKSVRQSLTRYENGGKELSFASKLKRKFGITVDDYERMFERQNGCCQVCGTSAEENGKRLAVDHSHSTGAVRDLLCNNCNATVGFVGEDAERARKLAEYLEKWKV